MQARTGDPRGRKGGRGRPLLDTNWWLEQELRRLADPYACQHLYEEWMVRYRAETGRFPADPRTSFRQAVLGCIRRLFG
jgi:hypothetical protein